MKEKTSMKSPSVEGSGPEGVRLSQQEGKASKQPSEIAAYAVRRDGTTTPAWAYCPEAADILVVA